MVGKEPKDEGKCRGGHESAAERSVVEVRVLLNRFLVPLCSELIEDVNIIIGRRIIGLQVDEPLELVDDQSRVATVLVEIATQWRVVSLVVASSSTDASVDTASD